MAKVYDKGTYGMADEESKGLLCAQLDMRASVETAFAPDHVGDDAGVAFFNEQAEISGQGLLAAADTISQTLGAVVDIANTSIFGTDTAVTVFYVTEINLSRFNRQMQGGDFRGVGRVKITDTTATTVS